MLRRDVVVLIQKEFKLELRRRAVIASIALYLFSLVFICYLTFNLSRNAISEATWSALFWLTVLFSVINSVSKSFVGERKGTSIYFYSVASPQAIILSKIIYNAGLCFLLSVSALVLFQLFITNPIGNLSLFLGGLLLTSIGFSASLSLVAGIASKTNNSNVIMAVLSFPVVLSILLMAIRITKNCLDAIDASASYDELLNLFAINCILGGLAYLLFPYIWRS